MSSNYTPPLSPQHGLITQPRFVLPDLLQFMQLLWALAHGLETTSKRMTIDLGITAPQRLALRVVGLFPGLSAGDLARVLRVHPSTLTGVLHRLVTQGLLERVEDSRDRRRSILHLTINGHRTNAISGGTVEAAIGEALHGVTDHDRVATRRVFGRLIDHLSRPGRRAAFATARRRASDRKRRRAT